MEDNNEKCLIKNAELIDYPNNLDIEKLNKWTIPTVGKNTIYEIGYFNFKSRLAIKNIEQTIQISNVSKTIPLLNKKDIAQYFDKYKYIHIGLIQIAFKPLTMLGNDTSIMAYVRDARNKDFKPSLAAMVQTSLCHGPVYFDVYPNLTLSLTDKHLFKAMELTVNTSGYNFHKGSEIMAVCYRICYKVLNSVRPNVKHASSPGTTTVVNTNLLTSNVAVNRLIKWNEISFPETWQLPQEVDPEPVLNQEIDHIIQTTEGDIEVTFAPNQKIRIPRSMSSRSYSKRYHVDLPRSSTSNIDIKTNETTSNIDSNRIHEIRTSENQVPYGIYDGGISPDHSYGSGFRVDD